MDERAIIITVTAAAAALESLLFVSNNMIISLTLSLPLVFSLYSKTLVDVVWKIVWYTIKNDNSRSQRFPSTPDLNLTPAAFVNVCVLFLTVLVYGILTNYRVYFDGQLRAQNNRVSFAKTNIFKIIISSATENRKMKKKKREE